MKNILFLLCGIVLWSCTSSPNGSTKDASSYSLIVGKTMGTTYSAKFQGGNAQEIETELNALFEEINMSVSTYIDKSLISQFNSSSEGLSNVQDKHFQANLIAANSIYDTTKGLFDPTVMPLVNYWGFGYDGKKKITEIDKEKVKEILQYIGWDKLKMSTINNTLFIQKKNPKTELDFSALAKGYGSDMAAKLLEAKGIQNYLVEIGGEVVTKGVAPSGKAWVVGVNTPKEGAAIHDFKAYISLSEKAMATSGNYRNYYSIGDQKFSHTIHPQTGFPERSNLLSATIIADDCMTADAFATASMVAGLDRAYKMINHLDSLEALFIYADENGKLQIKQTEGFKKYVLEDKR